MKKTCYFLFACAALLFASSCSKDETIAADESGTVMTTFNIGCENTLDRAISDGTGVNVLYYETYLNGEKIGAYSSKIDMINQTAQLTLNLAKDKKYTFAFWAQDKNCTAYDATNLIAVKVNYGSAKSTYPANDETRDAFCKVLADYSITGDGVIEVKLQRPFAQINLGRIMNPTNSSILKSSFNIEKVANCLNVISGAVTGEENVVFGASNVPGEALVTDSNNDGTTESYDYLSMNYILAGAETTLSNVSFTLDGNETVVSPNTPLRRNYRTNIICDLTAHSLLSVTLDPVYEGDENMDKSIGLALVNGVYEISNGEGLALASKEHFANGGTFSIVKDIDMKYVDYKPVAIANKAIVILGNNHSISNFNISGENRAALIGKVSGAAKVTISDLTIKNSSMESSYEDGENSSGAFVGFIDIAEGVFTNCKVENVKISCAKYIGGIVAYMSGTTTISNCSVKDVSLLSNYSEGTTYKGHAGGVIGYMTQGNVSSCNIDNVCINGQWGVGNERYGIVVGSIQGGTIEKNTANDCKLLGAYITVDSQLHGVINNGTTYTDNKVTINGEVVGYTQNGDTYTLTNSADMFWFADQVNVFGNTFAGKTIIVSGNIDLKNKEWEPIGNVNTAAQFAGTFDGGNNVISNMKVSAKVNMHVNYSSGLFGMLMNTMLKNIKLDKANVSGHHFVGGIAGNTYASIDNCVVTNSTITNTAINKDADGDKTGCIAGYVGPDGGELISNCHAENCTVSGGRDAGQIIGCTKERFSSNNTATSVKVTANGTSTGENVRNDIIGRILN